MATDDSQSLPVSRKVPVVLFGDEGVTAVYADHATLTRIGGVFTLSLFQLVPPVACNKEEVEAVETIRAKCVARIALPPSLLHELLPIINAKLREMVDPAV
jgi:hypothetical protein